MRALIILLLTFTTSTTLAQKRKDREPPRQDSAPGQTAVDNRPEAPPGIIDREMRQQYRNADAYIRAIVDRHEAEFPGALAHSYFFYPTTLNRISYIQQGVVTELMQTPGFEEAFRSREPLTDLKVVVVSRSEIEAAQLNERAWEAFILDDVLIAVLTAEERSRLVSEKDPTKRVLAQLRGEFVRSWNRSYYPEESPYVRAELYPYVVFATLAKQYPDANFDQLIDMILGLDVGALDYFEDAHSWEPLFEEAKRNIDFKFKFDDDIAEAMDNAYHALNKTLYDKNISINMVVGDSITIREVHPDISIFRGYVGNDCATCFSPGFVLNPFDRYYYVFDEDGSRLGYVGLSIVKIEGEKSLLIHTIQGPDFDERQTQLVLRGFKAAAESFGAKHVVLSNDDSIWSNVNFLPIRRTMVAAVAGQPELKLKWEDMKYREIIVKWDSEWTYDDPNRNRHGRALTFNDDEVSVEVTQKPFDFTLTAATPEILEEAKRNCTLRLTGRSGGGSRDSFWGL